MEEGERPIAENDAVETAAPPTTTPPPSSSRRRKRQLTRGELVIAGLAVLAAVLLRLFVYESDIVEGPSMHPGLRSGDYVLVYKRAYHGRSPQRFDVVVLRSPVAGDGIIIKRVIGLPGEWVWAWNGQVHVNGGYLVEPYAAPWSGGRKGPVWVPPGYVYVMGDNRDDSEDSRAFGPVALTALRGKALFTYFPPGRARKVR